MEEISQTSFKKERQQTDDSLTDERGKTDESFENYKGKAELETNNIVVKNRLDADNARFKRRFDSDIFREGRGSEDISKKSQNASEQNIMNERKSEDYEIEKERSTNDLAIKRERGEKERLLTELVTLERETTDKHLLSERKKNDLATKISAKLLTNEQAAHISTQSALTTHEEFMAIVSHDLRNPIGAILFSTELLSENPLIKSGGKDIQQLIDIIKRNAEISLRLIRDILDMERITEGKIQLQLAPCQINDLLRESIESHKQEALAKGIQLTSIPAHTSEVIMCDKDRITQVLSNLIGNALKFTPRGGSVTIGAIDNTISVSDTGPGIPEEQKERIFERFAQLKNKNRQGLGLGLYISKTLIEAHKGKLWVELNEQNGSTFSFILPK